MVINRLAHETSPYLLQHADNPVDWMPWGEEAFARARDEDKPIFLSVGYSSCHWCHVMAHESFEDPATADVLNERFVNVKVDREERPDVDAVYMDAVTTMTGHGGWPMSVFLSPDGRPFYGGTYWPSEQRHGMPAFTDILDAVHEAWTERRGEVGAQAARIADALTERGRSDAADRVDPDVPRAAAGLILAQAWDRHAGGFGKAPKFPQAMTVEFLLDRHTRTGERDELLAAGQALDAMARGGIHDHVAGGFARYSTDANWLVPHFEKMLYDNALLLAAYAKAGVLTGDARFTRTAVRTADFLLREFRLPDGGFIAATDADSEGVEGKFFVWSDDEFREVVAAADADPERFARFYGVVPEGNWEGVNILHEPVAREDFAPEHDLEPEAFEADIDRVQVALYERRSGRVPPGRDDKVLASWNGLAIRGLARAGSYLGRPDYVTAAETTAAFIEDRLVVDGVLHHTWKDGTASVPGFLEDVAFLAAAYLDLYAATGTLRWFDRARELATDARERFHDDRGGFFQTPHDGEALYKRPKDTWDNATPSGNSVMAEVALRLEAYTGETAWGALGDEILRLFQSDAQRMVTGFGWYLQAADFLASGPREVAIVGAPGPARDALVDEFWARPRPGTVLAVAAPDDPAMAQVPLLAGRTEVDGAPAAYVCRNFACERPVTTPEELRALLV